MYVSVGGLCVHDMFVQECINLQWVIVRHTQTYTAVVHRCTRVSRFKHAMFYYVIINAKVVVFKTFWDGTEEKLSTRTPTTFLFCFWLSLTLCICWCGCTVHLWVICLVKKWKEVTKHLLFHHIKRPSQSLTDPDVRFGQKLECTHELPPHIDQRPATVLKLHFNSPSQLV